MLGTEKFQPPSEETQQKIRSMEDRPRLMGLLTRLLHVDSWQELFAEDDGRAD